MAVRIGSNSMAKTVKCATPMCMTAIYKFNVCMMPCDVLAQEQRQTIVENACPGPGACGGMYTANTMASAIEVGKRLKRFRRGTAGGRKQQQQSVIDLLVFCLFFVLC